MFASFRDRNREIYLMNPDGSQQINITNHPEEDVYPTWSSTGEQILFVSDRDGVRDLYLMDPDGEEEFLPKADWFDPEFALPVSPQPHLLTTTWAEAKTSHNQYKPKPVPAAPALSNQLVVDINPENTTLLANYPNLFNPETWIPYHLAEPADVTLRIYAANGVLVRILVLGHQPTGVYQRRNRAAYWDGRNEFGEPVASGIYFYTLSAGDFTATRKMLILK